VRRRESIAIAIAATAVGRARAQQPMKVYRIAMVHPSAPTIDLNEGSKGSLTIPAIFKELRRLGYVEGQNLSIDRYSGGGHRDEYPELARKIVRTSPDLIEATDSTLVLALKNRTTTIPIVGIFGDPLRYGIVSSLARPGGNVTGVAVDVGSEQWGKRLALLKAGVPQISRVGIVASLNSSVLGPSIRDAARQLGVALVERLLEIQTDEAEYRRHFTALIESEKVDALIVGDQASNNTYRPLILNLTANAHLPAMYAFREFVAAGGLMSYGVNLEDVGRRIAKLIDLVLKGANPGEIPIFQPTKFEFTVNLKTAKTLGIAIPDAVLAQADEVIE
jgi:putative tryptophan/tyrosine transport system substrate-binding protein